MPASRTEERVGAKFGVNVNNREPLIAPDYTLANLLDLSQHVGRYLSEFCLVCDATCYEILLKAIDRIVVFLPPFDLASGNVALIIVLRVSPAPVSFRLNQKCAAALAGPSPQPVS